MVATRERPGANLVINCDEYSGRENSICGRHRASQETAYQPQAPSERAPLEMAEPMAMAPRHAAVASFHHVEHLVQPTGEPTHVHASEGPTESYQASEDSKGVAEQSRPMEEGEHVAYEGAVAASAGHQSGTYESEHHESGKETPVGRAAERAPDESYALGQEAAAAAGYDGGAHHQPATGQEQHELSAGFDEQQPQGKHEAHWHHQNTGGPRQQPMRRAFNLERQTPDNDYVKQQVEPGESNSAAAHQTRR